MDKNNNLQSDLNLKDKNNKNINKDNNQLVLNNIPNECKFKLFKDNDNFIYKKKFFNTLPYDIFPPKSFSYTYNNESISKFNKDVMLNCFSNSDCLITDYNLNTNLEESFLKCSLNVLYNKSLDGMYCVIFINLKLIRQSK